jgi:hypothetical protein
VSDDDKMLCGGSVQACGSRGVWVPDGMTAEMVMVGATILEREFGIEPYRSRSMVRSVWEAISQIKGERVEDRFDTETDTPVNSTDRS